MLGMAPHTFYKYIHEQPDRCKGMWSVVGHDRPQMRECSQFFAELHMSAAEHLAEQCLDPDNSEVAIALAMMMWAGRSSHLPQRPGPHG